MTNSDADGAIQQFLLWEMASQDTIDFKKIYVDIAGDLIAGLMLSQIVYWHLPSRGGESKLRIERDNYEWLAKAQHEWWNECRLTAKQIRRARKILEEKGIIATALYKFGGAPTTHIRINWDTFLQLWNEAIQGQMDFDQKDNSILTKGKNPNLLKVKNHSAQKAQSITKNTNKEHQQKNKTKTTPTTDLPSANPESQNTGVGDGTKEIGVFMFLVEKCGIWETTAKKLIESKLATMDLAARWWAVLKNDENIRNPSAVLVHHLENKEVPPEFTDERQRYRYQQYLWDYELDDEEGTEMVV